LYLLNIGRILISNTIADYANKKSFIVNAIKNSKHLEAKKQNTSKQQINALVKIFEAFLEKIIQLYKNTLKESH
jgi:hypothetical protein